MVSSISVSRKFHNPPSPSHKCKKKVASKTVIQGNWPEIDQRRLPTLKPDNFTHNLIQIVLIVLKCIGFHAFHFNASWIFYGKERKETFFSTRTLSWRVHPFGHSLVLLWTTYLTGPGLVAHSHFLLDNQVGQPIQACLLSPATDSWTGMDRQAADWAVLLLTQWGTCPSRTRIYGRHVGKTPWKRDNFWHQVWGPTSGLLHQESAVRGAYVNLNFAFYQFDGLCYVPPE